MLLVSKEYILGKVDEIVEEETEKEVEETEGGAELAKRRACNFLLLID